VGGVLKVFSIGFAVTAAFIADSFYNVDVVNSIFNFSYDYDGKINSKEHVK